MRKLGGTLNIINQDVCYTIRYLQKDQKSPSNEYSNPNCGKLTLVKFGKLEELNTTAEKTLMDSEQLFQSTDPTFGAVESFQISKLPVFDLECFQVTGTMDHGVNAKKLEEIRENLLPKLRESRFTDVQSPKELKIRLFFVVPPENFDAPFKFQNYRPGGTAMENVHQYALKLDAGAISELQPECE